MSLPLLIALLAVLFFGLLTISSSIQEARLKKRIKKLEDAEKQRRFEEKIFTEVQDSLDYSLNTKKILSTITAHLPSLLSYATVSTLIVKNNSLEFAINAEETVSHIYVDSVKETMIDSLQTLEKRSFQNVHTHDTIEGNILHNHEAITPKGVVHFPLMLHHSVTAILTITSTTSQHFPADRIESLQRIISQTSRAMSKLDAAIQVEKGRLNAMMGSLQDGIFMIDTHNNLLVINATARHLLSLHKETPTTMDVLSALPIHFDFNSKIQTTLRTNQPTEIKGVVIKDKLLNCGIFPVQDTTGKILGASIVMHDETLKNALPRMKEDFTNIIVHELRSPLTAIKASSELLKSRPEFTKDEQQKLSHLIFTQSNLLLGKVNQILDAAKLETGVFAIHKHQGDLKQLINEVTSEFLKEAQDKMINLGVTIEHAFPAFSFDSHYLGQALSNIISNSLKFTGTGGSIQIQVKQKEGNAIITVTDTGGGIPKDKQHNLFNKFSQLADASAQVGKGLGLYVVKGIIHAHGGKVDIDSDRGRGTSVTLTLPLANATHTPLLHTSKTHDQQRLTN